MHSLDTGAVLDRLPPTTFDPLPVPAGRAEVRLAIKIGTMFARGFSARPARVYVAASTSRKGMAWQPNGHT